MTPEECNKIIAEHMDRELIKKGFYWFLINQFESSDLDKVYSESLDALVPVWERYKIEMIIDINNMQVSATAHKGITSHTESLHCFTVKEAAAVTTAKAIQELSK